jgi:hypothetical protein
MIDRHGAPPQSDNACGCRGWALRVEDEKRENTRVAPASGIADRALGRPGVSLTIAHLPKAPSDSIAENSSGTDFILLESLWCHRPRRRVDKPGDDAHVTKSTVIR